MITMKFLVVIILLALFTSSVAIIYLSQKKDTENGNTTSGNQGTGQDIIAYNYNIFRYTANEVYVENANAPQYDLPVDLSKVKNIEHIILSPEAKDLLEKNGFVVVPGKIDDLAEFYKSLEKNGFPVFITSDSVLFVYHTFFDMILIDLEEKYFVKILNSLLSNVLKEADRLYNNLPENTLAKTATKLDIAFLSVALKLLNPEARTPSYVGTLVNEELNLILGANQPQAISPIFGYKEDYTQYKPRGHYTLNKTLERYFRTMMWLGRMRFEAQDPMDPSLAKIQTAQALILTYLMLSTRVDNSTALNLWEKIYLPTSFIVGSSDDLTFYDYIKVMREVYGEFSPIEVNDASKLKEFMEKIVKLDKSRIISSPIFPEEKRRLVGLRFMGQRFILDGYIHQQLCYSNLPTRFRVTGLDIMAALGSERAFCHLEPEFKKHVGFKEKLLSIRENLTRLTQENWTSTLYMGWLYSLKSLLVKTGKGYPTFMTTVAWQDKCLNTALSSWAQLRHDTILYAKQPYAELTAIPPKQSDPGYVEPNTSLYSRLRNLAQATKNGLSKLGLIDKRMDYKLKFFIELLNDLLTISQKELLGEKLSKKEQNLIKNYGYILESLLTLREPKVKDPRIIADVFTEPNSNMVLEIGTGYFDKILVVYKTPDEELYISVGATMSYYEFYWPQTDRLTDDQWRKMIEENRQPPQPEWVRYFKVINVEPTFQG